MITAFWRILTATDEIQKESKLQSCLTHLYQNGSNFTHRRWPACSRHFRYGNLRYLQAHLEKGTCPKSLRYNVRANIMPDMCAFSAFSETRNKGETTLIRNRKRKQRKREKHRKRFQKTIESRKQHIKNLSDKQLTDEQISLLSTGLKFIPTPATNEGLIRRNLLKDFNLFARRMRLQYIFHGKENKQHPFYVKSTWEPPVQQSVALETFLEEVQFELANIPIRRPKDNLSPGERRALHNLLGDNTIIVKKADKGTTTVIMSREQKIKEGQILLNDLDNYRPLEKQMAVVTAEKIKQLTTSMLTEGHIDVMTVKWLSQTPNPPRIPEFYTLTKIHKPTLVGRPIISGCDGPTERISCFVDRLIQPIVVTKRRNDLQPPKTT